MGPGSQTTTRRQTACPRSPTTAKLESFVVRSQIWSATGHTLSAPGFAHGGRPQGERHGRQPARVTQGVRDPCVAARQLDRHHLQVPRRVWSPCCVLKAPRESAPPSVRTNVKKHQRLCPPIGKEIGVEGFWPGCAKALIRASSPSHRRVSEAQAAPGDGPKQWLMQPATALDRGLPGCSGLPFSLGIKPVTCLVLHTPPRRNPVGAREGHTFPL